MTATNGATRGPRRQRDGVRSALIAIVVSALALGGLAIASADNSLPSVRSETGGDTAAAPSLPAVDTTIVDATAVATTILDTTVAETTPASAAAPSTAAVPETSVAVLGSPPAIDAKAFAVYDVTGDRWLAESG